MSDSVPSALAELKRRLRKDAGDRRAAAHGIDPARETGIAGAALRDRALAAIDFPRRCVVSAYWPMGSEIDPRPLMERLHAFGHPLCLPVVIDKRRPLVFRAWTPGQALDAADFGTRVPAADRPRLRPRVVLTPMLAFDRRGYRLGHGGGFYDRTLRALRTEHRLLAIGLGYGAQELPAVPHDDKDQRLDWIVTETEAIAIN